MPSAPPSLQYLRRSKLSFRDLTLPPPPPWAIERVDFLSLAVQSTSFRAYFLLSSYGEQAPAAVNFGGASKQPNLCCRNNRILSPHRQWRDSPFFFVLDFKGSSGSSLNVSSSLVPKSVKPCSETPVYSTGQKLEMVKTDSTIIKAPLFNWYCQSAVSIWTQNNSFSINECSSLHGRVSVSTYNARSGDCFPFFGFVSLFSIWTPVLSSHIQHAFVTFVTLLR